MVTKDLDSKKKIFGNNFVHQGEKNKTILQSISRKKE